MILNGTAKFSFPHLKKLSTRQTIAAAISVDDQRSELYTNCQTFEFIQDDCCACCGP